MLDPLGVWVGIDVSKRFLDVCIDATGTPFRATNDPTGFARLLNRLASQKIAGIVVEHTGQYSEEIWRVLHDAQYSPSVVHPNHIVRYRSRRQVFTPTRSSCIELPRGSPEWISYTADVSDTL